jgi:hypothetical protein
MAICSSKGTDNWKKGKASQEKKEKNGSSKIKLIILVY